ncbi:MAG: lamin tail domain-containing protein, partial [Spirosomaceae bacterium]|nr:lamin tail domain-containing protein [Spirosomataceae bacterium]
MNSNNFMKAGFLVICYFYSLISNCQQPYELLITEIMADPTPSRGLPEIEFLEVYNSSNKPLQLSEYTLYYNTFQTNIPSKVLLPNEYAILVRNGNEAGFQDLGMVLSLPRLSLLNGGTIIRLVKENTTVFEVN